MNSSRDVASAHDQMADEYDAITDTWYTHLFGQIHTFLLDGISRLPEGVPRRALDIGCGTGLQSLLLADAGFEVFAFDLSEKLIEKAHKKLVQWPVWSGDSEFDRHMRMFHERARTIRGARPRGNVEFHVGDALDRSNYKAEEYGVVNCCGSVLSFVEQPDQVLRSLAATLAPGGVAFLEVEMKANLDILWPIIDKCLFGVLGYDQELSVSLRNLGCLPGGDITTAYPFELAGGSYLSLPMTLFSYRLLRRRIAAAGLRIALQRSIHCVTNIIPSTRLHSDGNSKSAVRRALRVFDDVIGGMWPFRRFGCSGLFELVKS